MELLRSALRSLTGSKTRSLLTMLGIIIGVASVIVMVSVGKGASSMMEDYMATFGANIMHVFPQAPNNSSGARAAMGTGYFLTLEDARIIAEESFTTTCAVPFAYATAQTIYGNSNWNVRVTGSTPDFLRVRPFEVERGVFITDTDVRSGNKVCVLGATPARELFGQSDPIDAVIRIGRVPFRVVGVLKAKGIDAPGNDDDDLVVAPVTTVQRRLYHSETRTDTVNRITIQAKSRELLDETQREITAILRQKHRIHDDSGDSDDFSTFLLTESLESTQNVINVMSIMLSLVAGISLVIGGIGIMNIMLVTVSERTHEIGIRMSVGARPSDIRVQFLAESAVLSTIGGLLGIALGAGVSHVIASVYGWPVFVSMDSAVLAAGFSGVVGIIFGLWPAWRASRLDPIEALRND
ncbi:MAG: ABC transporter permease [Synergistaceae bacterium]|nr:ABC transporter permease [Synergistaceae bacterium]